VLAVLLLLAGCATPDMSRETSLAIVKLVKAKN
jgi:hypothetical protein